MYISRFFYSVISTHLNYFILQSGIETKATQSVRSPICNLFDENPRITVDGLQTAIGWEYLRTPALHIEDGGLELIAKQKGFQIVNPIDYWFPGDYSNTIAFCIF